MVPARGASSRTVPGPARKRRLQEMPSSVKLCQPLPTGSGGCGPEVQEDRPVRGSAGRTERSSGSPAREPGPAATRARTVRAQPRIPCRDARGTPRRWPHGRSAGRRTARGRLGAGVARRRRGRRRTPPRARGPPPRRAGGTEPGVGRHRRRGPGRGGEAGRRHRGARGLRRGAPRGCPRALDRRRGHPRRARSHRARPTGRARDAQHRRARRPRCRRDRRGLARHCARPRGLRADPRRGRASWCGCPKHSSTRSPGSRARVPRTCSSSPRR